MSIQHAARKGYVTKDANIAVPAVTSNTNFTDISGNNITIQRTGTPFQTNTLSPYATEGGSFACSSGQYLTATNVAQYMDAGAGDFTAECWFYATADVSAPLLTYKWGTDSNRNWTLWKSNQTTLILYHELGGFQTNSGSTSTSMANVWRHCAYTRWGNTHTVWIQGTSLFTWSRSGTYSTSTAFDSLGIGFNQYGGQTQSGRFSDIRFTIGNALYKSNFVPPTQKLTAGTQTEFLCTFDYGLSGTATNIGSQLSF